MTDIESIPYTTCPRTGNVTCTHIPTVAQARLALMVGVAKDGGLRDVVYGPDEWLAVTRGEAGELRFYRDDSGTAPVRRSAQDVPTVEPDPWLGRRVVVVVDRSVWREKLSEGLQNGARRFFGRVVEVGNLFLRVWSEEDRQAKRPSYFSEWFPITSKVTRVMLAKQQNVPAPSTRQRNTSEALV